MFIYKQRNIEKDKRLPYSKTRKNIIQTQNDKIKIMQDLVTKTIQ